MINGVIPLATLHLRATGITRVGLSILVDYYENHRGHSDIPLRLLSLDHNDLSEALGACEEFSRFSQALGAQCMELKELNLRSTRLNVSQLSALCRAIPLAPRLHRLTIQGVALSGDFQSDSCSVNPLLRAVADPRSKVKYVDVSAVEHKKLHNDLMHAAKNREKKRVGDPEAGAKVLDRIDLSVPILARVRELSFVHPHYPARANLECQFGTLEKVDCDEGVRLDDDDVGKLYEFDVQFRDARLFLTRKNEASDIPYNFKTRRGIALILVRTIPEPNGVAYEFGKKILAYRPRPTTQAAGILRARFELGILPDFLAQERRFHEGISNKKLKQAFSFDELMHRISCAEFSDKEVKQLAQLEEQEHFRDFLHKSNSPGPELASMQARALKLDGVMQLVSAFEAERVRRGLPLIPVDEPSAGEQDIVASLTSPNQSDSALPLELVESRCSHQSFMGSAERFADFETPLEAIATYYRGISGRVCQARGLESMGKAFTRVVSVDGGRELLVCFLHVAEDLIDDRTQLPLGCTLNPYRSVWVDVDGLCQLADSLVQDGFPTLPDVLATEMRNRQVSDSVPHLERVVR
ncbi:unnamed protein product [Prorocentrum cordatum]|uniref:Uncharacterized protein n=1 Tax=Prorocentrum cordatum TaxID=2364126 RepID=A0ABN9SM34_9DINO|nr:unnamed protein product [Polarella glacialis]